MAKVESQMSNGAGARKNHQTPDHQTLDFQTLDKKGVGHGAWGLLNFRPQSPG